MGYVKTGLGIDKSRFQIKMYDSTPKEGPVAITQEMAEIRTREQIWVDSLKDCNRPDGKPGWLYTNRYGKVTCTANPVGDRKNELRGALAIVPPLISSKVAYRDGKWIPIIPIAPPRVDKNYFRLVLNALSNVSAQGKANAARVSWEATKDGVAYSTGRAMSQAEVESAVNTLHKEYSDGGKSFKKTKAAFSSLDGRQALRKHILIRAVELQGTAQEAAAPAEYAEQQRQVAAKQSKTLLLVGGGVGILIVGALLLKGRK